MPTMTTTSHGRKCNARVVWQSSGTAANPTKNPRPRRTIELCVFDQSDNYLQEVGLCTEDCELDDYAEELWQEQHEEV